MGTLLQQRSEVRGPADLAGKYRLIAELGQGGMATVYLAVAMGNSGFRKLAVVKLLRPEFAVDEEFIQMFLDEARLCARLSHPNIVHTYDVGADESGHLIAMEYLDGVSLHAATAKIGRKDGPFGFELQARVLLEVIEGLRYAHELVDYDGRSLQIVHRDVTPHNIFVTYDGQVKLLDFGIAKAATSSVKTATGVIKGKLTYMAPEQARGDAVDARADLYAVGVMLWEAVTGRRRWPTGLTEPALFTRLATGELPDPPDAASRGLPAEIDGVVMRAMAPKAEDRYQTAVEFRDALDAVLRKTAPVSLRDLGAMLAKAFNEDRQRIRHVIEDQFRAIEVGQPPSSPNQLPAVPHPSFMTASESIGRKSSTAGPRAAGDSVPVEFVVESQSRRITAPAPEQPPAPASWPRSRVLIIGGGFLAAAAIALAAFNAAKRPPLAVGPEGAASIAQKAHEGGAAHPSVGLVGADPAPEAVVSAEPPAVAAIEDRPPPPPAHHTETVTRRGPVFLPSAAHADPVRAPSALASPAPPGGAATAPATPPADSPAPTDPPPLRTPSSKPKVQLEREIPWP